MTRMLVLAAFVVAAASGCHSGAERTGGARYMNAVDPCWPERYSHEARLATLQPFQAQTSNGVIMNQTIWDYHFDQESDVLTRAGQETLDSIVRRRPSPDGRLYLQTTQRLYYDKDAPEKMADKRRDLDERRIKAIQTYLAARTAGRPMSFEVQVIDPAEPSFGARYLGNAINSLPGRYNATIGGAGAGASGSGSTR